MCLQNTYIKDKEFVLTSFYIRGNNCTSNILYEQCCSIISSTNGVEVMNNF